MRQSFFAVYINEMDSRNEGRLDVADNILDRKTVLQVDFDCEADQGESARRQEQFGMMRWENEILFGMHKTGI